MTGKVRSLKIEAEGDRFKGRLKSKIRISGHWLRHAGFSPGDRVSVICVEPGKIELHTIHTNDSPVPIVERAS